MSTAAMWSSSSLLCTLSWMTCAPNNRCSQDCPAAATRRPAAERTCAKYYDPLVLHRSHIMSATRVFLFFRIIFALFTPSYTSRLALRAVRCAELCTPYEHCRFSASSALQHWRAATSKDPVPHSVHSDIRLRRQLLAEVLDSHHISRF